MFRQGDVLIIPCSTAEMYRHRPQPVIRKEYRAERRGMGLILAEGEQTGHHHTVKEPHARLYRGSRDTLFLTVPKTGASVTHQEHDPIDLPGGKYKVVRQREYEPPVPVSRGRARPSSRRVFD